MKNQIAVKCTRFDSIDMKCKNRQHTIIYCSHTFKFIGKILKKYMGMINSKVRKVVTLYIILYIMIDY